MTNREAFNLFMTFDTAKQLKCMETIENNALVRHSCKYDEYGVHSKVYDKMRWLRYEAVGVPIGKMEDVIKWLDEEASEKVTDFIAKLQRELESEDRCNGCGWCDEVLKEYRQS